MHDVCNVYLLGDRIWTNVFLLTDLVRFVLEYAKTTPINTP